MSFTFSGPSFVGLFPALAGAFLVGSVYQSLTHPSAPITTYLLIREVADFALYKFVTFVTQAHPKNKAVIYALTNLSVNIAMLFLLLRAQKIGKVATAIFIGLMAVEITCKCLDFPKYRSLPEVS